MNKDSVNYKYFTDKYPAKVIPSPGLLFNSMIHAPSGTIFWLDDNTYLEIKRVEEPAG